MLLPLIAPAFQVRTINHISTWSLHQHVFCAYTSEGDDLQQNGI